MKLIRLRERLITAILMKDAVKSVVRFESFRVRMVYV